MLPRIRDFVRGAAGLALMAGLVLGAGPVAQAADDGDGGGDPATSDSDVSGSNLSIKEKQAFAEKAVSELDGATRKVLRMIEDAQKAKNVMLLNCLNEKLAALRGLLKVGEDAAFGLNEAIARENADLQEHNFRKVFISRNQGLTVAAESDACVGDSAGAIGGGTKVVVTVEGGADEGGLSDFGAASSSSTRAPDTTPTN